VATFSSNPKETSGELGYMFTVGAGFWGLKTFIRQEGEEEFPPLDAITFLSLPLELNSIVAEFPPEETILAPAGIIHEYFSPSPPLA